MADLKESNQRNDLTRRVRFIDIVTYVLDSYSAGICVSMVAVFLVTIVATSSATLRGKEIKGALRSGPPR